jgi:hypothetical protein
VKALHGSAGVCSGCGRKRGDGRRDRGWKYFYADSAVPALLTVRFALCASCLAEHAPIGELQ